jgi:EAL domain-containing protein (putative c-di-GMP-specific phosphodiesterase class I)
VTEAWQLDALAPAVDITFRPVADLFSGRVLAHEVSLPGWGSDRDEVTNLATAVEVEREVAAAVRMVALSGALPTPVHIPLHPRALLSDPSLPERLAEQCAATRRAPNTVTIQLAERYCMSDVVGLRRRCAALRRLGFAIGVDDVGAFHGSLSVLAAIHPQVVKVHHTVVHALEEYLEAAAVVEAVVLFARRIGATLMASGVDSDRTVSALRSIGVGYGQGALVGGPERQWRDVVAVPPLVVTNGRESGAPLDEPAAEEGQLAQQTLRELLRRAISAHVDAAGDEIRELFGMDEDLLTVILTDDNGRVAGVIPRGTFMLAASGPFGHALHARRGVVQHSVTPRMVRVDTPVSEAIRLVTSRQRSRVYDDLVVADNDGRCVGIVRVADLLTAVQRNQVDVAISLDPLTELPSGKAVEEMVRRLLREPAGVAVSWVELNRTAVIEAEGFLAGNALVVKAAAVLRRVASYLPGSWLGHLGAGSFVLLTERADTDRAIRALLDSRPEDRYGKPVDLAVGALDCPPGFASEPTAVSERLAEVLRHAHQLGGTSWASATFGVAGVTVQYASKPVLTASTPDLWKGKG